MRTSSCLMILATCLPLLVYAETYQCPNPNGAMTLQDHACAEERKETAEETLRQKNRAAECARAKILNDILKNNARMAQANNNSGRNFYSDAYRARIQNIVDGCR